MIIRKAEFISSNTDYRKCPKPDKPEYAFIGRSNVGKSSLINHLLQRKNLARVSATPGKTRLINHFNVNDEWLLVDLPGYGYARISKSEREKWEIMIRDYLLKRTNLMLTFILIDSRIEFKSSDKDMINWFGEKQLPFALAFTKTDKLSSNQLDSNISAIKNELIKQWDELPPMFITSSETGLGCDEIMNYIEQHNQIWMNEIEGIK
ncbi:MAG TPA: ribosome biogenesis GTP-binding protein YihA/YsxC [Lentimicrobium sp.]|nr:ribosome biogenesis GTP-binding protein YihA/YsxC [Lentimicrobium sp.]